MIEEYRGFDIKSLQRPTPAPPKKTPLIRIRGLTKRFGSVEANKDVSLDIHPGRILALLGENGAGKSTLMSMLAGRLVPDEGFIEADGGKVRLESPAQAIALGVGMVYQHFTLVEAMTVAENVLLGQTDSFFVSPPHMKRRVAELATRFGLDIDPGARVADLSMGEKQRVEILKLLHRQSRVLILDEPTTVLTPAETRRLFDALWSMAAQGKAIVFISHKLEEVMAASDDVAILRKGRITAVMEKNDIRSKSDLARSMVGRDVILSVNKPPVELGEEVLGIDDLSGHGLKNVSLSVRRGEILALTGVAGNGQKALVEMVCGLETPPRRKLFILGERWRRFYARAPWKNALSYVPEDRKGLATAPNLDLVDNVLLTTRQGFVKGPWLMRSKAADATDGLILDYNVSPPRATALAKQLSGGNLQKLVLGRELYRGPRLIVAEQPTQGLDVSATEEVWTQLLKSREDAGVLLVTGDVNEALNLADRIAVIYRGEIMGVLDANDPSQVARIGPLMAGLAGTEE
ncbi:MAG: ral nucleoside transport system ATP-binding protein [Desulfovibrionales bacterium]|nr:ral nucleoside transport system ATP-binding protein [Desulfovibrionales bacterium]